MRHLLRIDDLQDEDISWILDRASRHAARGRAKQTDRPRFSVATLFLSPSLRTKAGFSEATIRLGGATVDVSELRWDPNMSDAESFEDTLRTVSGMVDVTVVRAPVSIYESVASFPIPGPVICGGDVTHHPTQALIDVFAIERCVGPIGDLAVALCGDLTMRSSRSLIDLFRRRPPRELLLVAPDSRRDHGIDMSDQLSSRTRFATLMDAADCDVVNMVGLAPKTGVDYLDDAARAPFTLTTSTLAILDRAMIFCPMPVIDEISVEARRHERVRIYEQSDLSVHVRMAALEWTMT